MSSIHEDKFGAAGNLHAGKCTLPTSTQAGGPLRDSRDPPLLEVGHHLRHTTTYGILMTGIENLDPHYSPLSPVFGGWAADRPRHSLVRQ
jgi:hypothetical protein